MRIEDYNDEIIRRVKTFRNYNQRSSELVREDYAVCKDRRLAEPIFCGTFDVKIYVGNQVMGIYRFDCRHFRNFMEYDELLPRLTKIK